MEFTVSSATAKDAVLAVGCIEDEITKSLTLGRLKINENAEVLDKNNNVIKGLYAAGEVIGGIHGGNRLGGNAVVDIAVFGTIAGESVSK